MSRILIISGHPRLDESIANATILRGVRDLAEVTIRHLDQLYPDYTIDVDAEQAALLEADTVVLQFPFYWYSVPALLKKWIDDVLSYGFAYGSAGDKLKGKTLILSCTVGGPEASYGDGGHNHFTIEQLFRPLHQTAMLAGMVFHPPVVTHGMIFIPGVYNTRETVERGARDHAERLAAVLAQG